MKYTCPVCGYKELLFPPSNFHICDSCGTEFDNDDVGTTIEELRQQWIANGKHWWSPSFPAPTGWNPARQLSDLYSSMVSKAIVGRINEVKAGIPEIDRPLQSEHSASQARYQNQYAKAV